ncbi:hypothetical protein BDN72DRAFT_880353 [Pluteus cervinus]|uniref:Uncharacterized protein n=1 Tax=Pluteus cervinus TaxID=181527 RepID=A0ACD3AL63_9AGAR|nr:hypothetical protein BDN72DRAFT_880353 [Pluteus cervinus]
MAEESLDDMSFDLLPELRDKLFSFGFPHLTQPSNFRKDKRLIGPSPFTFYDRHVNENQRLIRVASCSTLADDLIRKVDDRLAELQESGEGPLPVRWNTLGRAQSLTMDHPPPDQEITPDVLINRLGPSLSAACLPFVSNWIVHPRAPRYDLALSFNRNKELYFIPGTPDSPREDLTIRFLPPDGIWPDTRASLDDLVKEALQEWHDRDLVTWILLPLAPDSEQLLRNLDQLFTVSVLPSPMPPVDGLPVVIDDKPPLYDAEVTPWRLPALGPIAALDVLPIKKTSSRKGRGVIFLPSENSSQSKFEQMREPTPEGLVHHAWRLAVQRDTTIIVMSCGNYERVGIRHRSSRTLYLSDIIDVTKPGYGKLHLGILMSVVDDALNRYRAYRIKHPISPVTKRALKRKANTTGTNPDPRRSKRQRVNAFLTGSRDRQLLNKRDTQLLWREMDQRPILLLQFSGGSLNSSKPTCCLRKGRPLSPFTPASDELLSIKLKESYQPSEYCLLTLDGNSSSGMTGRVYPGQLQVTPSSGRTLSRSVVAKITDFAAARERLRHEYQVYQHLWSHGINRIPEIYGLFEDMDNFVTILVMERAACTFREREPTTKENKGGLKDVPPSERLQIMQVIETVHKVGVVHQDLRPDNLVLAQDGKPMIIDFDQAVLDPTDDAKDLELKGLDNLLSGKTNIAGHPL